jgi:ferredoxin
MPDPFNFATVLVDINTFIRPRLFVMDGITAMEGNGPYGGKSRQMNVLLFSSDPIALDSIACKMIDLNPEFVPTSEPGERSGLGTYHYENIEVVGDSLNSFIVKDFRVVRKPPVPVTSGRLRAFIKNQLTPRPVINLAKCNRCGTCLEMCPVGPKALDWVTDEKSKSPKHKYSNCIRCYCCQEICPQGAITVRSPLAGRLILRN